MDDIMIIVDAKIWYASYSAGCMMLLQIDIINPRDVSAPQPLVTTLGKERRKSAPQVYRNLIIPFPYLSPSLFRPLLPLDPN